MTVKLRNLQKSIIFDPSDVHAVHYIGVTAADEGRVNSAKKWITRSLFINSNNLTYKTNYAIFQGRLHDYSQAENILQSVLNIDSNFELALLNLGHIKKNQKNNKVAISIYLKVIALNPQSFSAYDHLSYCHPYPSGLKHRYYSAQRAHKLCPKDPNIGFNYGLYCLLLGNFSDGWRLMHFRWGANHIGGGATNLTRPIFHKPAFNPEAPVGPVLIWAEQGLGDEIMFLSLLKEFQNRTPLQLIIQVDERMLSLWRRSFEGIKFISRGEFPAEIHYSTQLPTGDLPAVLQISQGRFISDGLAFLSVDRSRRQALIEKLVSKQKPIVGLGWRSKNGDHRCIPLKTLEPILKREDCSFVNLQYGDCVDEIRRVESQIGRQIFQETGIDCQNDLDGLAALMTCCDVVISVANATVHLAGALGVNTISILPIFPGWRWLSEGESCIWYRSVRVIRQTDPDNWEAVIRRIESELRRIIK